MNSENTIDFGIKNIDNKKLFGNFSDNKLQKGFIEEEKQYFIGNFNTTKEDT